MRQPPLQGRLHLVLVVGKTLQHAQGKIDSKNANEIIPSHAVDIAQRSLSRNGTRIRREPVEYQRQRAEMNRSFERRCGSRRVRGLAFGLIVLSIGTRLRVALAISVRLLYCP